MSAPRIFTFWEPRGSVPPYLRLCRETWIRNSPGFVVTELNYDNVEQYAGAGALDFDTLKTVRMYSQKDAIMFAVLARHGGVFMDMDTIVFADLSSLERRLRKTELVMFHVHLGFAAARPASQVMEDCLAGAQRRLSWLREGRRTIEDLGSDYLGNAILHKVLWDGARRGSVVARVQGAALGRLARLVGRAGRRGADAAVFLDRVDEFVATQVIHRYALRDKLLMLRRDRHGFIAERVHGRRGIRDPRQRYLEYWFGGGGGPQRTVPSRSAVIGLHNSWTPGWYAALSEAEVLDHECLLSRTLRAALGR